MPYYRQRKSYFINSFKFVVTDTITSLPAIITPTGFKLNEINNPNRKYFTLTSEAKCLAYKLISPVVNQCTLAGVAGSFDFSLSTVNKDPLPKTNGFSIGYSIILVNDEQYSNIESDRINYNGWGVISKQVYPVTENLLCYDQGILNREINLKTFEFSPKTKRVLNEKDMLVLTVYHNIPDNYMNDGLICMISGSLRFFIKSARR